MGRLRVFETTRIIGRLAFESRCMAILWCHIVYRNSHSPRSVELEGEDQAFGLGHERTSPSFIRSLRDLARPINRSNVARPGRTIAVPRRPLMHPVGRPALPGIGCCSLGAGGAASAPELEPVRTLVCMLAFIGVRCLGPKRTGRVVLFTDRNDGGEAVCRCG